MKMIVIVIMAILAVAVQATAQSAVTTATYEMDKDIKVMLMEKPFDRGQARIEPCAGGVGICRINGAIPFGIGGGGPKTELAGLSLTVDGRTHVLDTSAMYNAWGKKSGAGKDVEQSLSVNCFDASNCIVRGIFSESAGAYVAEWAIVDGHTARTMLTGSRDVVDLFRKHIAPPVFE